MTPLLPNVRRLRQNRQPCGGVPCSTSIVDFIFNLSIALYANVISAVIDPRRPTTLAHAVTFNNFVSMYGKSYATADERDDAEKRYNERVRDIVEQNRRYESGLSSFSRVINKYADMTDGFLKTRHGFSKSAHHAHHQHKAQQGQSQGKGHGKRQISALGRRLMFDSRDMEDLNSRARRIVSKLPESLDWRDNNGVVGVTPDYQFIIKIYKKKKRENEQQIKK